MPLTPASGDTGYWAHLVSLCAMNLLSDSLYKGINIHKYFIKVDMNVDIFFSTGRVLWKRNNSS